MCSCWGCSKTASGSHQKAFNREGREEKPYYALTTLPLRRQDVHTRMRLVVAPTRACTGRRLTFQRRLVTLWAWLMRFPACGFLPQISHCCAMTTPDNFRSCRANLDFTGGCQLRQPRCSREAAKESLRGFTEFRRESPVAHYAILNPCSPRFRRPPRPPTQHRSR